MAAIRIEYALAKESDAGRSPLHNRITALLAAVAETGSLAGAAERLGYSYRHVWNLINAWEKELGISLLERGKGRAGKLTPAARRWIGAEKEILANYADMLASLRADLERGFERAMNESLPLVRLSGCPDEAIQLLRQDAVQQKFLLEVDFNSSIQGLQDLAAGRSQIAGFNFPVRVYSKAGMPHEFKKFFEGGDPRARRCGRQSAGNPFHAGCQPQESEIHQPGARHWHAHPVRLAAARLRHPARGDSRLW